MFKNFRSIAVLSTALAITLGSCSKDNNNTPPPEATFKYGLVVSAGTPAATYSLATNSLTEGTLSTVGNGAKLKVSVITSKNGVYYGRDDDAGTLVKFTVTKDAMKLVKEIPFNQISWAGYSSFYKWKDDKTLVLFSNEAALQFQYAILDVENMKITASGNINVPKHLPNHYYWAYNAAFVGNKLYLAYTQENNDTKTAIDTTYVASMDFPSMTNIQMSKDVRFTFPSHYTLNLQASFTENNTAYFLTSPTVWATSTKNKPFGIFKVNGATNSIDPDYFYELTDRSKEEALGLIPAGNGKAIVKILDKTQLKDWQDYSKGYIADYYLVDVDKKSKTKINIPKSISGTYSENVLVDVNLVYIAANTAEGYYVYEYNLSTTSVKKGLKIEGVNNVAHLVKF